MGDGQQAQVCVTSRSKPRGLEVLGVAGGALQLPVGRAALASRSVDVEFLKNHRNQNLKYHYQNIFKI